MDFLLLIGRQEGAGGGEESGGRGGAVGASRGIRESERQRERES